MELRIETQKQTLSARDESMKKLLEMLQSKGLSVQKIEDNQQEVEHLQTRQLEDDRKIKQLQNTISQNELEISKVKEVSEELNMISKMCYIYKSMHTNMHLYILGLLKKKLSLQPKSKCFYT